MGTDDVATDELPYTNLLRLPFYQVGTTFEYAGMQPLPAPPTALAPTATLPPNVGALPHPLITVEDDPR